DCSRHCQPIFVGCQVAGTNLCKKNAARKKKTKSHSVNTFFPDATASKSTNAIPASSRETDAPMRAARRPKVCPNDQRTQAASASAKATALCQVGPLLSRIHSAVGAASSNAGPFEGERFPVSFRAMPLKPTTYKPDANAGQITSPPTTTPPAAAAVT